MKIYLTDICGDCCPNEASIGVADRELSERIKARVMQNIGAQPPKRGRKLVRTLLLVAAAAALLTTAAYAVASFAMKREPAADGVNGRWLELDEAGEVVFDQAISFPDAGMVFTFAGPEEHPCEPELRAFWLPSEANWGYTDAEGWTNYLSDSGEGGSIPYIINIYSVNTGNCRYVLNGKPEVVREEYWGDWYVLEISSDYSESKTIGFYDNDRANYILLFDEARGYLAMVSGTSDMDTLEHIARELEIRESDRPYEEPAYTEIIGCLDVGRG